MDEPKAKLQIKIGEIEISLAGDSDFVSQHYDKVEKQLETFIKLSGTVKKVDSITEEKNNSGNNEKTEETIEAVEVSESILKKPFGEWLNIIPRETSDTDKALLAGYYTQVNSEAGTFRSRDVSKLLKPRSSDLCKKR